ncbi:MAG: hypothetical protein ACI3YA_02170 [Alloprevotella sp.]
MKDVVFRIAFAECSLNLLKVRANESKSNNPNSIILCRVQPNLRRQAKVSANKRKEKNERR